MIRNALAAAIAASTLRAARPVRQREPGRDGRAAGAAPPWRRRPTAVQRMSVQREVDLSGTLLSPDRQRSAARSPASSAKCGCSSGTEVKAGDVLVRLEPSELQFALDRAESALRQVRRSSASIGRRTSSRHADEQIASVRQAIANRDDARAAFERAQQLNERGLLTRGRPRHGGDAPQGRGSELSGRARHGAQPEGEPAGSPRARTTWRRRSWPTRSSRRRWPARSPSGSCSLASSSARTRRSRPSSR